MSSRLCNLRPPLLHIEPRPLYIETLRLHVAKHRLHVAKRRLHVAAEDLYIERRQSYIATDLLQASRSCGYTGRLRIHMERQLWNASAVPRHMDFRRSAMRRWLRSLPLPRSRVQPGRRHDAKERGLGLASSPGSGPAIPRPARRRSSAASSVCCLERSLRRRFMGRCLKAPREAGASTCRRLSEALVLAIGLCRASVRYRREHEQSRRNRQEPLRTRHPGTLLSLRAYEAARRRYTQRSWSWLSRSCRLLRGYLNWPGRAGTRLRRKHPVIPDSSR